MVVVLNIKFKDMQFVKLVFWAIGCFFLVLIGPLNGQVGIYDSGGPIMPEQGAYDVTFYELSLDIQPEQQSINGTVLVEAIVVQPLHVLVLDLDTTLVVTEAQENNTSLNIIRKEGKVHIELGYTRQPGEKLSVLVTYGGKPRIAPRAPWDGGFNWEKTPSGAHWIATSCQTEGADLWWPNKDHVSDEPDSMRIRIRVPDPLVVASNGRLISVDQSNGFSTYNWFVSTPINNYNVALNIAPYETIVGEMKCINGDTYPVEFYVLPEDLEKGEKLFPEILAHLAFYEKYLGPYPFRADKYGVAQTPHLGMEHQTIIAYGAKFSNSTMTGGKDWGFDALHHHELGHEWWGNMVTNADWKDMWIHEGFCSYMQALYVEELSGKERYREFIRNQRFANRLAVAPALVQSSEQIYRAPIYSKGSTVLHSLRYLMGDQAFLSALRRMAYPTKESEEWTDGRQCRFVNTNDFILICEEESGTDLDWFFDVYVRQPALPLLKSSISKGFLTLEWEAPNDLPFPMPIDIEVGGELKRLTLPAKIEIPEGEQPTVDPDGWVLLKTK